MKSNWFDIPDVNNWDKMPTKIRWNEGTVLVRYNRDDDTIVRKYSGIEKDRFKSIVKNIKKEDYVQSFILLCTLPVDSDNSSQIGNFGNFAHDSLDELFKYYCQYCDEETKFQVRNKYQSLNCSCVICGSRLSVIKNDCSNCNSESLFLKPAVDINKDYKCYNCSKSLYTEDGV
jgi:hypothetical protein